MSRESNSQIQVGNPQSEVPNPTPDVEDREVTAMAALENDLSTVVIPRYPVSQRSPDRDNILPQALRNLYLENPAPHESPVPKPGESQPQRNRLLSFLNSIKVRGGVDNCLLFLAIGEAKRSLAPGAPLTIHYLAEVFRHSSHLEEARNHYRPDGYGEGKREFLWEIFDIFDEFYQGELEKDIFDTEYMRNVAKQRENNDPWTAFARGESRLISRAEVLMRLPVLLQKNLNRVGAQALENLLLAPHAEMIQRAYNEMINSPLEREIAQAIAAHAPRGITLAQLFSFVLLMQEYNGEWALASFDWEEPLGAEQLLEQLTTDSKEGGE